MRIELKYPTLITDEKDNIVKDRAILDTCIGKKDDSSNLYHYLESELLDIGITLGTIELVFDKNREKICSLVSYNSPKKLNESELNSLVEETNSQMLDGYGESPWEFSYRGKLYYVSLCSEFSNIPLSIEQIKTNNSVKITRRSPIFTAIKKHNFEKIRKYYKKDHLDQLCQFGYPPIWYAINEELYEIAREMIEAGASVTFEKNTLLAACATNHSYDYPKIIEISELIISKGIDINQTLVDEELDSVSGYTALMWAANRGKKPLVELLLNNGADVNIQSKRGDTALTATNSEHLEIVKLLLDSGANPDLINDQGRNAVSELLWQAEAFEDANLGFSANSERAKSYIEMAEFIKNYKRIIYRDLNIQTLL